MKGIGTAGSLGRSLVDDHYRDMCMSHHYGRLKSLHQKEVKVKVLKDIEQHRF